MFRCALVLLSAVLAAAPAEAQKQTGRQKEIDAKIAKMRKLLREGKLVRSHVRVNVRLKNGNRLKGVVKDGRLIERVDGLKFVAAEVGARGVGIRIWYSAGTNSYVFVPYEQISRYWVGEKLDENQIREIESELNQKAAQAKKDYDLQLAVRTKKAEEKKAEQLAKKNAAAKAADEAAKAAQAVQDQRQAAQYQSLLAEFPPGEWSDERRQTIETRKVTIRVFPNAKEKRFLEIFEEWEKAVAWQVAEAEKAAKAKTGTGTGGGEKVSTPPPKPPK